MDQSVENKTEFKDRLINFYNRNKVKIYTLIVFLIICFAVIGALQFYNKKKNILIAEKYINAGIYLSSNKTEEAKNIYQEILLSKNKFYSILSLNKLVEKELITDKNEILNYFDILENTISDKDQKDLIILKKALYMIKISEIQNANNLLKRLADKDSKLKTIAQDLLKK